MSALSTVARREYYAELGSSLPPPVIDKPEYRERRLITAIEAFEALHPGDAYEARLAVQITLCGAHAADSLREAGVHREDFAKQTHCRAQGASMMREERATRRMLAQEQKVRLATEAVANSPKAQPAASATAPPAEPQAAPPPVQPAAAAAPQPAPVAAPAPSPVAAPVAAPVPAGAPPRPAAARSASPPAPPSPEAIARAEAFAQENIVAAAQIRHDRGVTPQSTAYFRHPALPTDPEVIDALVHGTSDLLTLLDEVGGKDLDEAA
jgi:hypothetical protein